MDQQLENFELVAYIQTTLQEKYDLQEIANTIRNSKISLPYNLTAIPDFTDYKLKQTTDYLLTINNQFESEETRQNKDKVIKSLQNIITDWSTSIAEKEKQIYKQQLMRCGAVLLPYGSQLLGVTGQESDLDLICVAPNFIDRKNHFFMGLYEILKKDPNVTNMNKIENSFNPIIKLDYFGFQCDINFTQINRDTLPLNIDEELDDLRSTILYNDRQSIDALNGRQNGFMIRNSVPNESQFIETLRIIKLWSKKRCISGNKVGYFGGISWAILVAKICQLFPDLSPHQTVYMFFKVYTKWDWSVEVEIEKEQNNTIMEKFKEIPKDNKLKGLEGEELIRIMTPALPCINSAAKVNFFTFKSIAKELQRALEILETQDLPDETTKWEKLISQYDLFFDFKHFLVVSIVSDISEEFHKWCGFCEAQLVQLQSKIAEYLEQQQIISKKNNLDGDKYELRISSSGFDHFENDYITSYTYLVGIKKLDNTCGPLFLIVPVASFADKIKRNKMKYKFYNEDNMKIYFSNKKNLKNIDSSHNENPRKQSYNIQENEVEIRKKIKTDTGQNHVELNRNTSSDAFQFDNQEMNKTLDDLF